MARSPAMLFYSNPPEDEALLRELFYNRVAEARHALRLLGSGELPDIPLSIHGPTRSGKSHFARYVVAEAIAQEAPFEEVLVQASDRSTARRVLAAMYNRVLEAIPQFPKGYTDGALESWQRDLAEFHDVRPLIEDPKLAFDVEHTATEAQSRSNRLGFSFAPSVTLKAAVPTGEAHTIEPRAEARFDAGMQRDQSKSEAHKVRGQLSLPTDDHVVAWILKLLDFRKRLHVGRRVLFLVDDLDLLDPQQENGRECSVLVEKLSQLARGGACVVVVTVRSEANNGRSKDLRSLVEIGPWNACEDLLAIYAKRIERFNDGEEVFTPDALRWLATHVEGSVGMFLQYCDEVSAKVEWPITLDALKRRLREQFAEWRRGNPDLVFILGRVEDAVGKGQLQIGVEASEISLQGSALDRALLEDARFVSCEMWAVLMDVAALRNVWFRGCGMVNASFEAALVESVTFESCTLSGAAFDAPLVDGVPTRIVGDRAHVVTADRWDARYSFTTK